MNKALQEAWQKDGFVIISDVFSPKEIEKYNKIVSSFRSNVETGSDEFGFGDRVGQLHQQYPELLELASSPILNEFLTWAFNDEPILMGSLQFERGTQQEAHIDAIFFWPEPSFSMAGVWVALEDISPEAGPLFYIPGSHKWPFIFSEQVLSGRPELAKKKLNWQSGLLSDSETSSLVGEIGNYWTEEFIKLEKKNEGQRVTVPLKAGSVIIWHSLLAHGGTKRINPKLRRLSAVFHYLGKNTKLFTFDQFMLNDYEVMKKSPPQNLILKQYGALSYMHSPNFVTYVNGQEVVNKVR
jgi:ectoine hydroxylase-related dioxygenase (phytanoyl-CoA dioxygenase family)